MAEMNEGSLSTLPSIVATPSHDRTPSNEVSPISASETSTACIRPSTSIAFLLCPVKTFGALSVSTYLVANGAGRRPTSSGPRIVCIRSPSRRPRVTRVCASSGAQLDYLLAPEQSAEVLELLNLLLRPETLGVARGLGGLELGWPDPSTGPELGQALT
jgi:hypothetical protein